MNKIEKQWKSSLQEGWITAKVAFPVFWKTMNKLWKIMKTPWRHNENMVNNMRNKEKRWKTMKTHWKHDGRTIRKRSKVSCLIYIYIYILWICWEICLYDIWGLDCVLPKRNKSRRSEGLEFINFPAIEITRLPMGLKMTFVARGFQLEMCGLGAITVFRFLRSWPMLHDLTKEIVEFVSGIPFCFGRKVFALGDTGKRGHSQPRLC